MKKILLALAIAIFTPSMGKSQQTFSAEESDTASLTLEEAKEKILANLRKEQVLSIANVEFGTSRKEAERKLSNVQKITSAEKLRSRAFDEIVPFRKFIIKDDTSALL